jgi:uncharacterized protein (DUF58 family)
MWGLTTIGTAFALALVAMSLTFMGGAVIVAVPLALVVIATAAAIDFNRRRKTIRSSSPRQHGGERDVDFTERDRQTLVSD